MTIIGKMLEWDRRQKLVNLRALLKIMSNSIIEDTYQFACTGIEISHRYPIEQMISYIKKGKL